jgi:hypothetical protein
MHGGSTQHDQDVHHGVDTPLTATGIRYILQIGAQPFPFVLLVSHRCHLLSEFSPYFYHNVGELMSPGLVTVGGTGGVVLITILRKFVSD